VQKSYASAKQPLQDSRNRKAIATEPQCGLCFQSASVLQHAEDYGVQPGAQRFIGFIRDRMMVSLLFICWLTSHLRRST